MEEHSIDILKSIQSDLQHQIDILTIYIQETSSVGYIEDAVQKINETIIIIDKELDS